MDLIFLAGLLAAILAAETATLGFPAVNRIAMAIRAMDYPGGRRSQEEAIPRLGGIAIAAAIAAGTHFPRLMFWRKCRGNITPTEQVGILGGKTQVLLTRGGGS